MEFGRVTESAELESRLQPPARSTSNPYIDSFDQYNQCLIQQVVKEATQLSVLQSQQRLALCYRIHRIHY